MIATHSRMIELMHRSSIPGAIWCKPVGWEPTNEIDGSEFIDGSWWDENEETAGLVYFGEGDEGDEIDAPLSELRVASTGNCRVVGEIQFSAAMSREDFETLRPQFEAVMDAHFSRGVDAGSWHSGEGDYWTLELKNGMVVVYDGTGEWWEGSEPSKLDFELSMSANA